MAVGLQCKQPAVQDLTGYRHLTPLPPPRSGSGRHREPGTRRPSIFHESASKSASRAPQHLPGLEIAARSHLEGSRGLERLPGAPFFSRVDVIFSGTRHFWRKKTSLRGTHLPSRKVWVWGRIPKWGLSLPIGGRGEGPGELGPWAQKGPRAQKAGFQNVV